MATLTTTITESVTLNGSLRGSTNSVTTEGINDAFERIVTCVHSQTTTIATFAAAPYTSVGAIDLDQVRYIRVTNLDLEAQVELAVVTTASNYQVRLTAGASHILARANESALAEEDTTPSFGTMENLASLQIRPIGATISPRIEIFVGIE
jgi:hypothetical protein|tara:strand:+ start:268 stop:720 length:453 start_codon:yes stop_codon:yes gene_type:complete